MRLIDEDVLEDFIKTHSCSVGTDGVLLTVGEDKRWNNLLEHIPTAYDVDKVVEQLEEFREEMEQFGCDGMLTDMIELVKGGGVNE